MNALVISASITTTSPISIDIATVATSLREKLEKVYEEFKKLVPVLDLVALRLTSVMERFCKPLLQKDPKELESCFTSTLPHFIIHFVFASLPLLGYIFERVERQDDKLMLVKLKEFEKEFFSEVEPFLKEAAERRGVESEFVIKANAALIDYDLLLFDMMSRYGLQGFAVRLVERAHDILNDLVHCLYSLLYATMSVDMALLGEISYNKETLRILTEWCNHYAEDLEDYLDTLVFLIPDENYEAVLEFTREESSRG